jgi:hypothetical protein
MWFMSTFLATAASPNIKDFIAPLGTLCGVVIAAFVAWFNARKTPADQLETLVNIYRDWPPGLIGQAALERSIALELAELRRRQPIQSATACTPPPNETPDEKAVREDAIAKQAAEDAVAAQADKAVSKAARNELWTVLGISVLILLAALALSHVDSFANYVPGIVAVVGGFVFFCIVTEIVRRVRHWT